MGTWDAGSFGNDDAADWVWQMEEAEDLHIVEEAFDRVVEELTGDNFVEAPTGSEAIAACEVIARLKGKFGERSTYSEGIDNWVAVHPMRPDDALLAKANRALDIVMSDQSELHELWKDTESFDQWQKNVSDLGQRMNA